MAPSKRTQVEETKPVAKKQNTTFSKKDIQSFSQNKSGILNFKMI